MPKDITFDEIANEIINTKEYLNLINENHHGINRYDHSIRVAKTTYTICKKLKIDYISATRAALLHDFFSNDEFINQKNKERYCKHPLNAVRNAKKYYQINNLEERIIKNHMFPLTLNFPTSKEEFAVIIADKNASIYEYSKFKASMQIGVLILFVMNVISISNK